MTEKEFHSILEQRVAEVLESIGFDYEYSPRIGGLQPDFLVTAPNGAMAVLEVKGWMSDAKHLERARRQAEGYKTATGAEAALVVLPEAPRGERSPGVAGLDHLESWLRWFGAEVDQKGVLTCPRSAIQPAHPNPPEEVKVVFAAMPFSGSYDDVYFVAMSYAAAAVGATCVRVDREDFTGDIVSEIRRLIHGSAAVIADLSESKPNVLYEVGYAHALGRPTVHICSTPLDKMPFDVAQQNTIGYLQGQTHSLRETLAKRLRTALSRK